MSVKPRRAAARRLGSAAHGIRQEAKTQAANAAMAGSLSGLVETQTAQAQQLSRDVDDDAGLVQRAGQNVDLVGLAIALVVVGVVMYVGLNVMSTTEQSTSLESGSEFNNASQDLTSGIADAYSLSGILFLVLILTGVVGLLLGLRARRAG